MDALRSALQPVTHNLPKPVANLGESLLNPICYKTLVYNVDLTATECVKLAISKGLDIGIVGAPSILKVPQLLKLINSQSAEGLSFLSYFLESGAYLISLSYNVTGFRSARQLSAFAVVNYPLGSLSRIFTTLQEVDDPLLLYGFIAGFAFNAVLSLQVIYYWNAPTSKDTESKKLD
ncbi:hypothetical protein SLS59_009384 [Nothophoma quercina]|uniref:Solute carrier family 66 member 3 n=2 Tax=Pleosporineae TaxID=715340 RepID=A0AB37VZJ5_9PLEO|nr:hypothetical protein AA0115_g12240 [Alternaria tenuissima]